MKTIDLIPRTIDDDGATIELGAHYTARIELKRDDDMGAPWIEHDGHGPVSDWRPRDSKRAGERILGTDGRSARFYDFAAAVKIARRDGWGSAGDDGLSAGAKAARAAERDYEYLRAWCNDDWQWVYVMVTLYRDGAEVQCNSCGGIESTGDYWREVAADCLDQCRHDEKEARRKALAERRIARHRAALVRCFC